LIAWEEIIDISVLVLFFILSVDAQL